MILDERNEFADATALDTSGTGLKNVGDQIPLSVARNVGSVPRPIYLVIEVVVAAAGASGGVTFSLVSDTSNPPLVDGTATVHWTSKSFTAAQLTADTVIAVVPLPGAPPNYETILGLQQNASGSAISAGTINAFLTATPKQWKAYPDAVTV
jgi:hypothetical protein